ncbi:hypothetical protein [Sphingobacterium faecale]|uniref:Uncharacterized protein n=1 Tax=Sphingobacterium faecale TaxID=2803775 RepID=A0ABS1R2P1_9SPHI|nr:hypothetical protein [Sphingobacterium faecale]MBL1408824.1 hypothetical protein [Sphingobacterium faecale]
MFRAEFSNYTPCFLKTHEIMNPFLVLRDAYQDSPSAESIIDDCWDLWTLAFRPDYWMTHESPKVLYEKFLKLARLLDAGWLVSKIRPSYIIKAKAIKEGYNPRLECTSNAATEELIEACKTINNIYNEQNHFELCFDLFNTLYQGLAPTIFDFEDLFTESVLSSFKRINQLIKSLFDIYKSEYSKTISDTDDTKLEAVTKFGLNCNVTQFNYYDGIDNIFEAFNKTQFFSIIEFLKSTSCSHCFWKNNGNPANVLYYMEELQFVMEISWEFIKELGDVNSKKWKIPKKNIRQIKYLPDHALKNPLKFLAEEFEERDLSNRRNDIEKWRLAALDNNWHNEDEHKDIQDFLLRLIEVASLLDYRPINC